MPKTEEIPEAKVSEDEVSNGIINDREINFNINKNIIIKYITDKLTGYLEGLYFNSNKNIYVGVYGMKTKQKLFMDRVNGEKFYLMREPQTFIHQEAQRMLDATTLIGDRFPLNEELVFEIQGVRDLDLNIIVRYSR